MAIDYKKVLESASKTMILVHEPDVLIKMIVRMIAQKVRVSHASILLHHQDKDTYILTVSYGAKGLKIPTGFARMDLDNPLVRFFREFRDKQFFNDGAIVYEEAKRLLNRDIAVELKKLLKEALYQMEIFEAAICIPSYFRNELLGMLLLGRKSNGEKFAQDELDFFIALVSDVAMAIKNARLFKELELELNKKDQLFIRTTVALTAAIEAKDHYTHGHTARVTNFALEIARKIIQENEESFDEKFLEQIHLAGLLHDIGKIGVPEYILNKRGELTIGERNKIKEHPVIGATILQPIKELGDSVLGVKYHHERYDGLGYPEGLKGDQIPLIASIISAADALDAMTSDRPYRSTLSMDSAIEEIKRNSGTQFNPLVVDALINQS